MSASKAADLLLMHTQHASHHQGQAQARAEAMRLVRALRQRAQAPGFFDWQEMFDQLETLETTLYQSAQEHDASAQRHNARIRQATEALSEGA